MPLSLVWSPSGPNVSVLIPFSATTLGTRTEKECCDTGADGAKGGRCW